MKINQIIFNFSKKKIIYYHQKIKEIYHNQIQYLNIYVIKKIIKLNKTSINFNGNTHKINKEN